MFEINDIVGGVIYACLTVMSVSIVLSFVRLVLGPSLADRIIALDLISYQSIALMLLYAVMVDQINFLEVALVLGLIAFLGTIAFSRYLEYYATP